MSKSYELQNVQVLRIWGPHGIDRMMVCDTPETLQSVKAWDRMANVATPESAYETITLTMFTKNDPRLTGANNG